MTLLLIVRSPGVTTKAIVEDSSQTIACSANMRPPTIHSVVNHEKSHARNERGALACMNEITRRWRPGPDTRAECDEDPREN